MEWVTRRIQVLWVLIVASLIASLPPIGSAPSLLAFSVFIVLWIASNPNVGLSLILGLSLSLSYAVSEVAFNGLAPQTLIFLPAVKHFVESLLSTIHFPLFLVTATWFHHRFHIRQRAPLFVETWFGLGLPALFVLFETIIPRPLQWKLGHSLYQLSWLQQGAEYAGVEYLSFAFIGMGAILSLLLMPNRLRFPDAHPILAVVSLLYWIIPVSGLRSAESSHIEFQKTQVLPRLIQLAVIADESKSVSANTEILLTDLFQFQSCFQTVPKLRRLVIETEATKKLSLKKDLVIWPLVKDENDSLQNECRTQLQEWVTKSEFNLLFSTTRNKGIEIAHLVGPGKTFSIANPNRNLDSQRLTQLASVSNGIDLDVNTALNASNISKQRTVLLPSGERLGITFDGDIFDNQKIQSLIDYGIYAFVNIGEGNATGWRAQYWLRAFDTMRSIEFRIPTIRVDSIGRSFMVDATGSNIADDSGREAHSIKRSITLPLAPPVTLYSKMTHWLTIGCGSILFIFGILIGKRQSQPIPLYMRNAQRRQYTNERP